MRAVNWFLGGLGGALGLSIAAITAAAPGDLIYEAASAEHVRVTAVAAVNCANTLLGTSYGVGDLNDLHVYRGLKREGNGSRSEQYYATAIALEAAPAGLVPLGSRIVGRVE